jgi:hypothetical protein
MQVFQIQGQEITFLEKILSVFYLKQHGQLKILLSSTLAVIELKR